MDNTPRKPPAKWHAVTVVLQTSSCAAAALCRHKKFLSREAPRLPMSGCDQPDDCPCTFRHFDDRRAGVRRASDVGIGGPTRGPKGEQRRSSRGRRARDQER